MERNKNIDVAKPTILDFKEFNYENCSLIENNNESMDVNFVGRNSFRNNAYTGNFNARQFPSNSSNNYGNSYNNSYGNFNTLIEEKMLKIDELARNVDRIYLDVDSLKLRSIHLIMILMSLSKK